MVVSVREKFREIASLLKAGLPVKNGGTGATTLDGIFELLSIGVSSADGSGHATIGQIGIEWGIVYVTPATATGSLYYGDTALNFFHNYTKIPHVNFSVRGGNYISTLYASAYGETKTSCSVRVTASNTTQRQFNYLIIGEIA